MKTWDRALAFYEAWGMMAFIKGTNMQKLIPFVLALSSLSSFAAIQEADRASVAAGKFCEERLSDAHQLQSFITKRNNQLYFTNQGGVFGGGVCWWHSRFTRSAAYLAVFDPSLPKPSDEDAKKIIGRLRDRKGVTLIPGFKNLNEFSIAYGNQIQSKLNDWQRSDGLLKASWVKGLSGSSEISAEEMSQRMDELFERVQRGEIVYQMLQMPGVVAHAWLVTGMEKTYDGYRLQVIDSNSGTEIYTFRNGMTTFNYMNWYKFVPYTGQLGEEQKLSSKLIEFCTGKRPEKESKEKNPDGEGNEG